MFDGKSDLMEHIIAINTQMTIIGETVFFKYKLTAVALKETSLIWYISMSKFSIKNYQDLIEKMIHKFSTNKERFPPQKNLMFA